MSSDYRQEQVAIGYDKGWSFTPLQREEKIPILEKWQKRPRETREEALKWARRGNVGIRCGKHSGGLVIIDVDIYKGADPSGLDLPDTITVASAGGGFHHYYISERAVGCDSLRPYIDVRGQGGQAVFPGGIHPKTGEIYDWADGKSPKEIEIATLTEDWWAAHGPKPKSKAPRKRKATPEVAGSNPRYVQQALENEAAAVAETPEGMRNDRLNRAAFSLGTLVAGGELDEFTVVNTLTAAAETAGLKAGEIRKTIRSGIKAGMDAPRVAPAPTPRPRRKKNANTETETHDPILIPGPHNDADGVYSEISNDHFADRVLCSLPVDAVYRRDCIPGELVGEAGRMRWLQMNDSRMVLVVDKNLKLYRWKSKEGGNVKVYCPCSRMLAGIVSAKAMSHEYIRNLDVLTSYPLYGPGWRRIEPGYQMCYGSKSENSQGIFYDEPEDLRELPIVEDPELIHNALYDLTIDFPFAGESDRHNFYGLMLTPIIALAVNSNRPLHLIVSPLERTGKTKLAEEVFGGIIIGRQTPAMQLSDRDEERDKRVMGLLLQGETLVHLDNMPAKVNSAALASLITATTYSGRILGGNNVVALKNNLTIVASGNNVDVTGELAKRTIPIVLQPDDPHPEDRTKFHHAHLRAYVAENRRYILGCLIGMIENWKRSGQAEDVRPLGGFEGWSRAIGGILKCNGFDKWRANEKTWRATSDYDGDEAGIFAAAWWAAHGTDRVKVSTLVTVAEEADAFDYITSRKSARGRSTAMGAKMRRMVNLPVGEWIVRRDRSRTGTAYYLERRGGDA